MRTLRFLAVGAIALSLLWACSDDEDEIAPEPVPGTEPTEEYDEAYYAEHATVSSEDAHFTLTDEGGEIAFKVEGGEVVVTVDCEVEWTAAVEYLDEEDGWLDAAVNCSAGTLTVTADANTVEAVKTAAVTVMTAESGIEFATISVEQNAYGACEIKVEPNAWNAPAVGELTTEIAVEANADWEVENTAEWLTAEKTDTGLKLTASENDTTEERTAEVVLTCTDGVSTASDTVTVNQDVKAYITVAEESKELTFTAEGGSETVEVESNFEVECSASVEWLTVEVTDGVLTVTASENETEVEREGTVTLTAGDGAKNVAEETVSVIQACFVAEDEGALVFGYTMTSSSQKAMLPLNGTVDCTVDWGDDSELETVTTTLPTHTYAASGDYEVRVSGTVTEIASYVNGFESGIHSYLTSVKQWGNTGLTSMKYAFRGCSKLTALPEETGDAFANVTSFSEAFYNCSKLGDLPSDLFANCTAVTTFLQCFCGCTGLTSLPTGLFEGCTAVTNFSGTFYGCTGLTSLPSDLFNGCTAVTNFSATFYGCSKLETIPEGLFDASKEKVTNVNMVFYDCKALKAVPDGLFKDFTALTNIASAFRNCTSLTSTGKAVFSGCVGVTQNATYLFYGCTSLETIEDDLFKGFTTVTSLQYAFYGCKNLKEIPAGLFDDCTAVTNFSYTFQGCSALEKIPTGLFDKNTKVTNFSSTFNGCSSLTEESPYTVVDGVNVHLYERADHTDVFTKPTSKSSCFKSCEGLSDYSSIPSGWGGGGD